MPDRVETRISRLCAAARRSKMVHDNDVVARDAAIHEADQLGTDVREIHRMTGATEAERLSISQVHRIVVREEAARQARDGRVME